MIHKLKYFNTINHSRMVVHGLGEVPVVRAVEETQDLHDSLD